MKMTKEQFDQFEEVLRERKYKKGNYPYKCDFEWFNNIIKEYNEDTDKSFALCVVFRFWDFSKYDNFSPKDFLISFDVEIIINDNTIPTSLQNSFFGHAAGNELFSNFNRNAEKEGEWYTVRNASKEEINDYIAAIEETAYKFKTFYDEHLKEVVFKNFRKQ